MQIQMPRFELSDDNGGPTHPSRAGIDGNEGSASLLSVTAGSQSRHDNILNFLLEAKDKEGFREVRPTRRRQGSFRHTLEALNLVRRKGSPG